MALATVSSRGLNYLVAVEGLEGLDLTDASEKIRRFASQAINATTRKYRTEGSRAIRQQVNFPASYLDSTTDGALEITRFANPGSLEAVIRGRFRPTSLARFVKDPRVGGRKSPTVEVAPGQPTQMKRAFLMGLNNGNVGLAIRLKPGERVANKNKMVQVKGNLYLLYGPSVDQVFREVSGKLADPAADYFEREFLRLTEAFI